MVRFTQPAYLLLIIPIGYYTYWVAKNSLADLSPFRRKLAIILRSVILLFLILAISGAQTVRQASSKCVIFALDVSESIPKAKLKTQLDYVNNAIKNSTSNDKVGVIVFGKDASVELTPGFIKKVANIQSAPKSNNTDISQALALALASFPDNSAKKIVLVSDGSETLGSALDQAVLAGANGVSIDTIAVSSEITKEVLLENMTTPTIAKIGEPFDVNIVVDSTKPTIASIKLLRNGTETSAKTAAITKGKTSIKFKQSVGKASNYNYKAIIESSDDTLAENNIASSYTLIKGKPRLLYIEGQPGQSAYLTKALSANDIVVEARDKSGIPASMADMRAYDMLVLSDVPAWSLSPEQLEMVRTGVKDMGIGFVMIGGENSFGAGGYFDTPIEKALPVDMSIKKTRVLPTLSVVIVMDKSGSMGMIEDGREKITLANDAAASVVKLLQPIDKVGVIVCHDTPGIAVRLGPSSPKGPIYDQISTIRAEGGGIMVFASMKAAYQMIKGSGTRQKHIILLADGSDCDDQNGVVPLVAKMAKEKITVTSVAIGDGPHVPFLKAVAYTGKGSYYLASRARDLKAIFTKDVMTISKALIVEEPFVPKLSMPGEELEGINTSAFPPLLGYVVTSPKPAGRLSLVSHKNDPILASWQYGLGRSIAFTSDCKSRWSARWVEWPEYNKFWSQISRWTMRKNASDSLQSRVELKNGRGQIIIDAMDEKGNFINMLEFNGSVVDPEVKGRSIAIEQTAPGRYEGSFEAEKLGSYVVSIAKKGIKSVSPEISVLSIPYPAEYKNIMPNTDLLKRIASETGGKFNPNPSDIFKGKFKKAWSYTDLWRFLTLIAIILLPLDIATRRIAFSTELAVEIYTKIILFFRAVKSGRSLRNAKVSTQEMGALLKAKRSVKENLKSRPEAANIQDIISAEKKQAETTPESQQIKPNELEDSQAEDTTSRLLKAKRKAKDERK